jgi:predicted molibdopterin-dependent oxidoreductase YjgC
VSDSAKRAIEITVDGTPMKVAPGTVVAAALAQAGVSVFRRSVTGEPRGPLCGMGVCFECRVTINGVPHCRSCLIPCSDGMEITCDE